MKGRFWLIVFTLLAVSFSAFAEIPNPPEEDYLVADFAGVLLAADKAAMLDAGFALEAACGAQVAAVTVASFGGLTAEEYAFELFTAWGIGQAGKDNGLLLLLSTGDFEYWIMPGYGFETALDIDDMLDDVDSAALDFFCAGDYSSGMRAAYEALCEIVSDLPQAAPDEPGESPPPSYINGAKTRKKESSAR